jgi:hypothetical protein
MPLHQPANPAAVAEYVDEYLEFEFPGPSPSILGDSIVPYKELATITDGITPIFCNTFRQ